MKIQEEMMKVVLNHIDPDTKLIYFTPEQWEKCLKQFNCSKPGPEKDHWLYTIADYIVSNDVPFPRKNTISSKSSIDDMFLKFYKEDENKWIKPANSHPNVLEKYDDYKRPFKSCGIGIINAPSTFNMISDYYTNIDRMACPYHASEAPLAIWRDRKKLSKLLGYFYRKPSWQDGGGMISKGSWLGAFRLGTYQASNFKPTVVKAIYYLTRAEKVLDTSSGWGDRLAGFYGSSRTKEYVGTDPNINVWNKYQEMCRNYERLLGCPDPKLEVFEDRFICEGKKKVTIYNGGAEMLPWDTFERDFDCAFTSPPYFSTELYAKGLPGEENQSWSKFRTYESWEKDFFIPVSEWSYKVLKEGGHFLCNIMDPTVKGKRRYSSDAMIDYMEKKYPRCFIGQLGMKYTRRAGSSVKSKEDFDCWWVENVWTFRKGEKKFGLMDICRTSLSDFF